MITMCRAQTMAPTAASTLPAGVDGPPLQAYAAVALRRRYHQAGVAGVAPRPL